MYIDEIAVFTDTLEEHVEHLRLIFKRLCRFCLILHPEKCKFARPRVEYLGHVISADGIDPNLGKVRAVLEFPVPTSVRGVWQFLGMASYYRRFIPTPLHALTRESVAFMQFWCPFQFWHTQTCHAH